MATAEEKQELVDTLKGHRYYRITLWGYGGESAYLKLTPEQYDFWKEKNDEDYDNVVNYMVNAEDEGCPEDVPEEMDFMRDDYEGETVYRPWYEAPTEFSHQWGVEVGSARITVDEAESEEYNSQLIGTVIDGKDLKDYLDSLEEENNYEISLIEMSVADGTDEQPDHVLQFYSSEKGTFFDGLIKTVGEFDIKKLKVYTEEYPNGEDIVTNITYDGEDIENTGGDTNGKGYSVHMWSNV